MRGFASAIYFFSAVATAQAPPPFVDGQPALASEVNAHHQYLQNQINSIAGSGGCSVSQLDASAFIECTDGTSAAIASVGRVVTVPEGEHGSVPDISDINTNQIYLVDANEVVLGTWQDGPSDETTFAMTTNDGVREFYFYNNAATQEVEILRSDGGYWLFVDENCVGDIWHGGYIGSLRTDPRNGNDLVTYFDPALFPDRNGVQITTIFKSRWSYEEDRCVNGEFPDTGELAIHYIFPQEIQDAAYPVGVKQFD